MSKPFDDFYRGKTVLVTGHTGFKGGWLAVWLKMLGANVVGFALPPEADRPSLFEAARIADNMTSVFGDVRDLDALCAVFEKHRPDIVFHLAAQALVRQSYKEPVETYATNVMGTVHVLEAVRQTPSVRVVVNVTSDKCYENREWVWGYREHEPMGGHDPYSSSKGCAELVTAAYRKSFFSEDSPVGLASARAGNVIGGGDWADDRLVPDIVRSLAAGAKATIRQPSAVRPWQHVLEPLRGYLLLGERLAHDPGAYAGAWNFGPEENKALAVRELAERLLRYWDEGALVFGSADGPHEAAYLKVDSSKARVNLGWRPLLPLEEALQTTVAWYKGYLADATSAPSLVTSQIQFYMDRMRGE